MMEFKYLEHFDSPEDRLRFKSEVFGISQKANESKEDNYLNEIVSYDANGKALTLSEYHNKVEEGLEDIKYNRVISQENLIEEMKTWKNE